MNTAQALCDYAKYNCLTLPLPYILFTNFVLTMFIHAIPETLTECSFRGEHPKSINSIAFHYCVHTLIETDLTLSNKVNFVSSNSHHTKCVAKYSNCRNEIFPIV